MRRIAIVFVLVAACDEPAEECENASGGSSSGVVESSSSESGEESTGEPVAPTCGEMFDCYEASCDAARDNWMACAGGSSINAGCSAQDAIQAGADPTCVAGAESSIGYAACVHEALVSCVMECGPVDMHAFELFRIRTSEGFEIGSDIDGVYLTSVASHCPGAL